MDYFHEDIIFMGLTLPFSLRRRGWGMRSKPDLSQAFCSPFPVKYFEIALLLELSDEIR
jgi:hypothetical protein